MDVVHMDFSSAFDTVSYNPFLEKFDALWARQVVSAVDGELVDRQYPDGGGNWLFFKLATCHK